MNQCNNGITDSNNLQWICALEPGHPGPHWGAPYQYWDNAPENRCTEIVQIYYADTSRKTLARCLLEKDHRGGHEFAAIPNKRD